MSTIEPILAFTVFILFFGTLIFVCALPVIHMAIEVYEACTDIYEAHKDATK
jgi:hypothetical protein